VIKVGASYRIVTAPIVTTLDGMAT